MDLNLPRIGDNKKMYVDDEDKTDEMSEKEIEFFKALKEITGS